MTIREDLQKLTPGNLVVLFDLDLTPIGEPEIYRFHAGVNQLGNNVVWGGNTYTRFPVEATGFERNLNGALPRPKLKLANIDGLIGAVDRSLGGLEGAKLTRTRTFLKYLDAVNFPGAVNPTADPGAYIEKEFWYVSRKSVENRLVIEYELAASFDIGALKIPRRQVIGSVCAWRYRSAECGYAGDPVADAADNPTAILANDKCGKRLSSCKLRFGAPTGLFRGGVLPYGGFPGAGIVQ